MGFDSTLSVVTPSQYTKYTVSPMGRMVTSPLSRMLPIFFIDKSFSSSGDYFFGFSKRNVMRSDSPMASYLARSNEASTGLPSSDDWRVGGSVHTPKRSEEHTSELQSRRE